MPILPNPRHERFAQEIAKGERVSKAYITAGFAPSKQHAQRLASQVHLRDRVEEIIAAAAKRAEITAERVMREYARIGFSDIRNAVNWNAITTETGEEDEEGVPKTVTYNEVALVGSDEIDFDTARAIAEISQTKDGALKVKFHDKKGALDSMARALGMFVDRTDLRLSPLDNLDDAEIDRRIRAAAIAAGVASETEH